MKASLGQVRELANTISLQADAMARARFTASDQWFAAKAKLILSNAQTLVEWTKLEESDER